MHPSYIMFRTNNGLKKTDKFAIWKLIGPGNPIEYHLIRWLWSIRLMKERPDVAWLKIQFRYPISIIRTIMVGTLGKLTALFHGNSSSKSSNRRPSVISTPPPIVLTDKADVPHLQRWSSLRLHRRKARQQGKYIQ